MSVSRHVFVPAASAAASSPPAAASRRRFCRVSPQKLKKVYSFTQTEIFHWKIRIGQQGALTQAFAAASIEEEIKEIASAKFELAAWKAWAKAALSEGG